ncbi:tetratricopeptide repeat protein [Candidatus Sumerlaeota bacterium]|nr:tetratricopeptide repeat protein [Candidatus Sumerlaeota bacterium]
MICPFCRTVNRDENGTCYKCEKDLSMLRLIVNKAKSHFNTALEFAERDRNEEAIAELHNAIDLDHTHVNSHVVLGTLYAKIGQLDRAEECWREALAVDPRFQKAHEYLEKLGRGRKSLPIVRRQRLLMTVMLVLLVSLAAWFIVLSSPKPSQLRLTDAWVRYHENDYAGALDVLQAFSATPAESFVGDQAQLLRDLIHKHMAFLLGSARTYLDQNKIAEARLQVQTLKDLSPPQTIREAAGRLMDEIDRTGQELLLVSARDAFGRRDLEAAHAMVADLLAQSPPVQIEEIAREMEEQILLASHAAVSAALELLSQGNASEDTVREQIETCRAVSADPDADEFLIQSQKAFALIVRTRKIDEAINLFKEGKIDQIGLLERMVALGKEYPDYEKLENTIAQFYTPLRDKLAQSLESDIETGRLESADSTLGTLEHLYALVEPDRAQVVLSPFRKRIEERRAGSLIERVKTAYASGDFEKTAQLARDAAEIDEIDDTTRAVMKTMLERSNARLAEERWEWMAQIERSGRYTGNRISLSEAQKTIEYYPLVEKHVSRKVYPHADETLLFYLAMSYRKVGQTDEAAKTFSLLEERFPESRFLEWVKRYAPSAENASNEKDGNPSQESLER